MSLTILGLVVMFAATIVHSADTKIIVTEKGKTPLIMNTKK